MIHRYIFLFFLLSISITNAYTQTISLDTTFGENGIVVSDIEDSDQLYDMVIQQDQKIIASGTQGGHPWLNSDRMAVVRYMEDGSLDAEFGDSGIVSIFFFEYLYHRFYNIALQQDGRIVLGGSVSYQNVIEKTILDDFALTRLNVDGSLDTTFGSAGLVVTDIGGSDEFVEKVLIQEDGKIIAAGAIIQGTVGNFAGFTMVRYDSNGDIDLSFGDSGVVKTDIDVSAQLTGGVIQPDGKIILSGIRNQAGFLRDFIMVRYLQNGTIDSLFGNDGIVQTDLEGKSQMDLATSIILEDDGKIVLGGFAYFNSTLSEGDMGVVRYHSDGSLDKSFGNNGVNLIHFGTESYLSDMIKLSDGSYLLTGTSNVIDSTGHWFLVLLKSNGQLDTTFASDGILLTDIEGEGEFALAILMQDDGKVVVGGTNNGHDYRDFVLARYIVDVETSIATINPLSIIISPNPCTDFLSVQMDAHGPFNCMISDLSGRVVWSANLFPDTSEALTIDIRFLNSGYYLLGMKNNSKRGVASFFVNK